MDQRLVGFGLRLGLGVLQELHAFGDLTGQVVLLGGHLALELVAPGAEHVGPGLHRVLPVAGLVHFEAAGPAHATEVSIDALQL